MIEKFQVFGATNSPDGVSHLLYTVQAHTGSSYRFSARTRALPLHFLIGKNGILLLPKRTENLQPVGELEQ